MLVCLIGTYKMCICISQFMPQKCIGFPPYTPMLVQKKADEICKININAEVRRMDYQLTWG